METTRQHKIAKLIQQDMSEIIVNEMKPKLGNSLITVTNVTITSDLSIARLYVSIFPVGNMPVQSLDETPKKATKELVMEAIDAQSGDLRRRLGLREAKQLRIIPHLEFYLDDTLDYMENIDNLLKGIK